MRKQYSRNTRALFVWLVGITLAAQCTHSKIVPNNQIGFSIENVEDFPSAPICSAAGDHSGDGVDDLLLCSEFQCNVILGRPQQSYFPRTVARTRKIQTDAGITESTGCSMGNLNDDAYTDLALGFPRLDAEYGGVGVFYGNSTVVSEIAFKPNTYLLGDSVAVIPHLSSVIACNPQSPTSQECYIFNYTTTPSHIKEPSLVPQTLNSEANPPTWGTSIAVGRFGDHDHVVAISAEKNNLGCLLYTSDAADE
eukprot:TRINITY_DN13383_c0_g1_i1.p1 TRINITY_DN13383_c0_g1~~TRINITY_DN13383_c0_g1_i1.p1  ORF type:complete len:252 (-),score=20.63 TRINITY_DN13383_c0_g1_i1:10-765(-)